LAGTLTQGAVRLSFDGNDALLGEWADELVAVANEQGFPHLAAQGATYRGEALVRNGRMAEGLSLLREGSAAFSAAGNKIFVPYHTALLARACEIAGQIDEAIGQLNDALQMVERTGERWLLAELYRHKGQLLLRQGQSEMAEELYRKALSIAEEQGAKLWELRTAMSLARLRCDQGRRAEARDRLAAVYGWFTEGFDTTNLKEAKALLDELT
jgi:predicted ATPase